ncbi:MULTISPECIES: S41 family peptidase [unclassified Shewanella]|uniref:S41 family peptidase n=1 Tax=unclassified Shewanella TaxID=196818 RepID=UPI001BC0EE09|nr:MULTISPECIES: S41 family peptidase [unclassified Shewanella]GIU05835.1 hypothetical protein TUM4444_02820 [Shewanella sp. MBTL60-112-B1]GIU25768.1 hypothetical protein TUM4445_04300 [Shewanella sp. MBTL60-112-B2]
MTLSYKSIFGAFTLFICMSAALLSYLSFFPNRVKTNLNHWQYQQDLHTFVEATRQHSAFAAIDPQRLINITASVNRLLQGSRGFHPSEQLQQQLQQLLGQLDDPSALALSHNYTELERLPIEPIFDGQYWQAVTQQDRLMEPDYPYLSHIDGIPISRWVQASQHYLPAPLKQSRVAQASWLMRIGQLRADIGLKASNKSVLTLTDGETSVQRPLTLVLHSKLQAREAVKQDELSVSQDKPKLSQSQIVRLASQVDANTLLMLNQQLSSQQVNDHNGSADLPLIIDIRAVKQPQKQLTDWLNTHFSHALVEIDADSDSRSNGSDGSADSNQANTNDNPPKQETLAVLQYKRFATARADRIASQYIPMEQLSFFEQIELNRRGFDNALNQNSPFSDYLIRKRPKLAQAPQTSSQLQAFLRIDASCEQECEWIALASKHWPRVALIGETSRGSLSPLHQFTLPNSGIQIQFSSGLVYNSDGQLISGVGISPAIQLEPQAFRNDNIGELISEKSLAKTSTANMTSLATIP